MNSNIPSEQAKARLRELSRDFKPSDVKFTLALNSSYSLEQVVDSAVGTLNRLKQYVENGCSDEGLNFKYKSIKRF